METLFLIIFIFFWLWFILAKFWKDNNYNSEIDQVKLYIHSMVKKGGKRKKRKKRKNNF